ncbi:hypothetical protein DFH07DRAFT_843356 [Mycena maculata]|uniref:Uncharacterized protein n=1 Tax=Mycena maculata TaxID=230809 RepID=A0AAD7I6H1_9AGAR|nr:hypothetical protein DFH07DRAFT_843356 [Mycena maculata]
MLTVEIHSFESLKASAAWPAQIAKTYDLLELPLPSWCSDEPYNASLNVPELSGAPTKPSEDTFENPSLRDFYDLALHTVAIVKSAMCHHGPRCTWPFVRGFTRVLAATCSQNAIILSHTPFVRPRIIPLDNRFDGIGEMLACHVVQGFRGTDDSSILDDEKSSASEAACARRHSNTTSSQNCHSGGTSKRENHPNGTSTRGSNFAGRSPRGSISSDISDADSIPDLYRSISSESEPSIDVSLNGHIFQGSGKHSYALLPFLCIADAHNILELMSSVACQRFVWGISEPAIGFLSSPSDTVMELVLSWVDQSTRIVHIAHNIDQKPGPAIGSFDFSNVASTLRFSQFILNLSSSISAVASDASRLCANNRLDWRSDNPKFGDFEGCTPHVAQWVRDVHLSRGPPSPTVPPQPTSAKSDSRLEMDTSTRSSRKPGSTRTNSFSGSTRYPTDSVRSDPVRSESLDVPAGGEIAPSSQTGKSRLSSSSLAEKSINEQAADQPHLLTYTFDRLSRFLTLVDHPKDLFHEEGEEIDKKMQSYVTMTAFQWFPPLVEDPFPHVSGALLPHKNALCNRASVIIQSLPTTSTLQQHYQIIIKRQIFVLLYASAGANILQVRAGIKAYEAESRHDWDALLYCFYIAGEEIVSHNILLERMIHYPKNLLAEEEDLNKLVQTVTAEVSSSSTFYLRVAQNAVNAAGPLSDLYMQASLASTQAATVASSYKSFFDTVEHQQELQRLIQHRSRREPKDGKCDAMCFFAVSSPSSFEPADVAALEFIKHTTGKTASKQKNTPTGEGSGRGAGYVKEKTAPNEEKIMKKGEGSGTELNAANRKRFLQNPFTLSKDLSFAAVDAVPNLKVPEFDAASFEGKLLFPHLVVEYKKPHDTEGKALNQGRMYLISLISFYAALKIVDRAFYALVTNGPKGALLMGWKSKKAERTYLVERNVVQFDISTPIGAYHFAIFLLRLREEQKELEALIEVELKNGKFDRDQFKKWRKESQRSHIVLEDSESIKIRKSATTGKHKTSTPRVIVSEAGGGNP